MMMNSKNFKIAQLFIVFFLLQAATTIAIAESNAGQLRGGGAHDMPISGTGRELVVGDILRAAADLIDGIIGGILGLIRSFFFFL